MPPIQYNIVSKGEDSVVTVFPAGRAPLTAPHDHPNFERIVASCAASTVIEPTDEAVEALIELFDIAEAAGRRFEALSERVTARNGRIYLDGDEVANALTNQIVRFLDEDEEDWLPLVNFFEKVQANPEPHSRDQLYRWLDGHDFTITPDGDIVGYKGVAPNPSGDGYVSKNSGSAIVNGEPVTGRIPTNPGDVVEMPRSEVNHDPQVGCSTGLHVGTYSYAQGWASGALLEVHVSPRDVVSVPTDCSDQKVRCCRYTIVDVIDQPYSTALAGSVPPLDDDYDDDFEEDVDEDGWDY